MIPLIKASGTPYEIGFTVGSSQADSIRAGLEITLSEFSSEEQANLASAVEPYLAATEAAVPAILEEMQGMADGAELPLVDLMILNSSAELHQGLGHTEACSVVGITQAGTRDGHVLLAHNEDEALEWTPHCCVIHAFPLSEPEFIAFTYGGLLLHQGLNSAGIGSVGNALYVQDAAVGVPKLLQYRRALAATTIEGAIRAVTASDRAFGNNHMLASRDGDLYDVEVTGSAWSMQSGGNRFLAHTNHLIQPSMIGLESPEEDLLNSRIRLNRLEHLIDDSWGELDLESLTAIMADHGNYPKSVCKHGAPESDLDYGTIGSVVMDLTAGRLSACSGNPCRGEWLEVTLESPTD